VSDISEENGTPAGPGRPLSSVARPKQARSERTLLRILESAESLIESKGLPAVSVPDIVSHADSSVGGFYARFKDKNELLRALEERFFNRVTDLLEALAEPGRWQGCGIAEITEPLMGELVRTVERNRRLIEAFLIRSAGDPSFRDDGLRFRQRAANRLTPLLLARRSEIRHPDPEVAIDLGIQSAFAMVLQHVAFGGTRAGGRELGERAVELELTRSFLGYLGVEHVR
jgi:AcrR family transcriptional regulator